MRLAASRQRVKVLNAENRCMPCDLRTLLNSADIYWRGIAKEEEPRARAEADRFEEALDQAGIHAVPTLGKSLERALSTGTDRDLTLKFSDTRIDQAEPELREAVLELSAWFPEKKPKRLGAAGGERMRITDAAEGLCLICVPRERLDARCRPHTFELVHLIAPQLSPERLERLDRCLWQAEPGGPLEEAVRPGLTGSEEIAIVPVWPDPQGPRQRWAVAAESSWVFAAPAERLSEAEVERLVDRMVPRWQRDSLPEDGAALGSVLVEVAIDSASRRAQALGRAAEKVFSSGEETEAQEALNRLGEDLTELNAGLDELEVAAADSRIDLERKLASLPDEGDEWRLYGLLRDSLGEELAKLDRQQQRLQGSFLAAREHASSLHVVATVKQLYEQREMIHTGQQQTEALNRVVGKLTVVLLGPAILFGALSITDYWLPHSEYAASVAVLLLYVIAGLALSVLIGRTSWFVAHLFMPRVAQPVPHDDDR